MRTIKNMSFLVLLLIFPTIHYAQDKYPLVLTITDSKGVQIEKEVKISVNGQDFQSFSPKKKANIQLPYNEQPTSVKIKGDYFLCGWRFHQRMKELNITVGSKTKEDKIVGIIQDTKGNSFFDFTDNFNILVNDKYYFSDSPDGKLIVGMANDEMPTKIQTLSPYFFMQDWWYDTENAQLHIVVSHHKPKLLQGVVYDNAGNKLNNVKIEIQGVRQASYSNEQGKFIMNLPRHLALNGNSTIIANNKKIPVKDILLKNKKNRLYLKLRLSDHELLPPPSATAPNSVHSTDEKPTPKNKVSDKIVSDFVFEDEDIEPTSQKAKSIDVIQNDINQIINLLEAEKQNLALSSEEIRRRLDEFSTELNNNELSEESKEVVKKEIHHLEKRLINNELAYQKAQEKTHELITQITPTALQQESLQNNSGHWLNISQKNAIIGALSITSLFFMALFGVYAQKNKVLQEKLDSLQKSSKNNA